MPDRRSSGARQLAAGFVFLCGLTFGLGLARYLFERSPTRLAFLGDWPASLLFTLLIALAVFGAWLATARLSGAPWATLAPAHWPLLFPLIALVDPGVNLLRAVTLLVGGVAGYVIFVLLILEFDLRSLKFGFWDLGFGLWPFLLALTLSALYLRALAPTVGEADTFEFQVDIIRLAVAHGSGYPLYILIGKLFSLLPVPGTIAFRINLSSAFFGVIASLGVYALVRRLGADMDDDPSPCPGASLPAAVAALVFGLSFGLWSRAVEAEVYTLNAAFVAAILWVCIDLVSSKSSLSSPFPQSVVLPLLGLLFGLSLTNHLTTILLAPAALAALVFAVQKTQLPITKYPSPLAPRTLALSAALFLLGLSVYLYIPIRWPAVNDGELISLAQFANILTGREAPGALRPSAWYTDPSRYAIVGGKSLAEFGWPGAILAMIGMVWLARRNWRLIIVLGLAYAGYALFAISFYVPDPDFSAFLLPAHLIQSVTIGLGVGGVARGVWRVTRTVLGLSSPVTRHSSLSFFIVHWSSFILHSAFILYPLSFVWRNLSRVDQSGDWSKYELGRYILSQPLAPGAVVLADSEKIAPLYYLQVAEGVRPDLKIVVLPDESAYRAALDEAVAAGKTVYLARYLPGLQSFFHLRSVGPLTEVGSNPLTAPPAIARPLNATFGGSIRLLGANFDATSVSTGDPARFTLYWQAIAPAGRSYVVRLRLSDATGAVVHHSLGRVPANNFFPTNAWQAGEIVPDFHAIEMDAGLVPGPYTLSVGLFLPFSEEGPTLAGGDKWAKFETITVLPSLKPPDIPHPVRFRYSPDSAGRDMSRSSFQPGSPDLFGFSREISSPGVLVGAMSPGNGIPRLKAQKSAEADSGQSNGDAWLLGYSAPESAAPGSNVAVSLYWLAASEFRYSLTTSDGHPTVTASFDPDAWPPGAIIKTTAEFKAPAGAQTLALDLAVEGSAARCGWLRPLAANCPLTAIRIEGEAAAPGVVNFGDKILLRSLSIDTPTATPGSAVRVSAEWQGLASMDADYTVFVHLIGPDGLVHGQIDTWPGEGTRPTSGWKPGEGIGDTYEIRVPDDAPPGEYLVEVGWYLLATLERLPVLGEEGQPVDDKILKTGLTVSN